MKHKHTISLLPDGTLEFLGDTLPIDIPITVLKTRRVSHILPMNKPKRAAFRILRKVFGERGKVAAWTRTWSGPWQAIIIATGETYASDSRQNCIEWELETLNGAKFDL